MIRSSSVAGLSTDGEPDLWKRDLIGAIDMWIDVGLPEPSELRKACGRAREVLVLAYDGRAVDVWWKGARDRLARLPQLHVSAIPIESSRALAALADRSMQLHVRQACPGRTTYLSTSWADMP